MTTKLITPLFNSLQILVKMFSARTMECVAEIQTLLRDTDVNAENVQLSKTLLSCAAVIERRIGANAN